MTESGGASPEACGFAREGQPCPAPPAWVIYVHEERHVACDAHRNDVLFLHETKDVAAILPYGSEVDDAG